MSRFPETYRLLLAELIAGEREANSRTGKVISFLQGAQFFQLDLSDGKLPTCGLRKTHPRTAAAETAWQILGHDHLGWLSTKTRIWDKWAVLEECGCVAERRRMSRESDGILKYACGSCGATGVKQSVPFAYGFRMRHQFGRDQLTLAMQALTTDPTDRRVWVGLWNPGTDGLGAKGQLNVPCPIGFHLSLTGGELHLAVTLRSSDVFVGLPYDIMNFAMLAKVFATSLNARLGTLSVTLCHAHLYADHFDMAKGALSMRALEPPLTMPAIDLDHVAEFPDSLPAAYSGSALGYEWPKYDPKPETAL